MAERIIIKAHDSLSGVKYCVNCMVIEATEALCDACLNEVVDMMAQQWAEQWPVQGGLY